jgi:hypothetical protein
LDLPSLKPYLGRAIDDSAKDVVEWITVLASGRDALMRSDLTLADARVSRYIPDFRQRFISAIRGNVEDFRVLLQLCSYCRKAVFSRPDLKQAALEKYLDCEKRAERGIEGVPQWLLERTRAVIHRWFADFTIRDYRPHHGPGAVAEPGVRTLRQKYDSMYYTEKCDRTLQYLGLGCLASYIGWGTTLHTVSWRDEREVLTSRLIFVPKTYKALRTVKPEPVTLQFCQKGVQDRLYQYIERHPYLSTRIPLRNQGQNRAAAREGSSHGWLATIDLSAASDSVSAELVEYLFAGTELGLWLSATRSEYVLLPDRRVIPTSIFAGMGSSLCFPVESIIFAAICEVVLDKVKELALSVHPIDEFYTVYGDDIIVPTTWVRGIEWCLGALGFQVNKEKSFSTGPFRESCGVEAFMGHDVTPFLYPFDFVPARPCKRNHYHRSPEFAAALASAANRSILEYGMSEFRYALLYYGRICGYDKFVYTSRVDERVGLDGLPYTVVYGQLSFWSPEATNGHLKRRHNDDLQRDEVLGYCIYTTLQEKGERLDARDDQVAYWEFLRRGALEIPLDPYSAIRATQVHLGRRWTGCE